VFFAHRGASREAPENTLEAFQKAVEIGVDVLELDVHLSADGQVVVHHDHSLRRTTNAEGLVRQHTFKELARLDAGYHFEIDGQPRRGRGARIPLLSEVLETFPGVSVNIEVKQEQPSMVAQLLSILDRVGPSEVLLAASNHRIMKSLEAHCPKAALGLSERQCLKLWGMGLLGVPCHKFRGRGFQVPPKQFGFLPVPTKRVLGAARKAGVDVHLWTLNDADQAAHWLAQGVDGIMTDDPRALAELMRAAKLTSAHGPKAKPA
jgi:glycerophosphoryl diester phosphodiesterase